MLHLTLPSTWQPERLWIAEVVLGQFLGLEYDVVFGTAATVSITAAGKTLTICDEFFAGGLTFNRAPCFWNVADGQIDAPLCATLIPVLFGRPGLKINASGQASLSLDVFGSAFFMLTRYEESVTQERDCHGRFPAEVSMAARFGFLGRPIVDEYVEILWAALTRLWNGLERKRRSWRKLISCDVDLPFDPACVSISRLGKRLLGALYRERSFKVLAASMGNYYAVHRGNEARDPYREALKWIMEVNEIAGNQVTFNFIPEATDPIRDQAPNIDDPRMRELLRIVHARGHLIGIHPGYNTYRDAEKFDRAVTLLRRALDEEHIVQDEIGGRQHYLRWDVDTTAQLWDRNALSYDSTLSYPTAAGFRAGTCHEYTMYDLKARRPLRLKQRPLVIMEHSIIDECNMGFGRGEHALAAMQHYKEVCSRFNGDFTLLWHNSSFSNELDKAMYSNLIQ